MTIYLDNAATSFPKPEPVCAAVDRTMRRLSANPGRGGHHMALDAARLVLEAREAVAGFFGAVDSSRIVFTASATAAINLALFGILRPGDRVVTTTMEHNAVLRPLRELQERGVAVVKVQSDRYGFVSPAALKAACRPRPRMLVISHCSNVTGTVQAIEELGPWCRSQGILLLVDAAQSAGHLPIHVEEMSIDLLAASGHKGLMGPPGTGFLFLRPDLPVQPLIYGGTGTFSDSERQPEDLPERLESGTLNTVGLAGLLAGIQFIEKEGLEQVQSQLRLLLQQILAGLGSLPKVRLYGPADADAHGGAVSFTVEAMDPAVFGFRLDREYGICCRVGLHCAPDAHRSIGTYPKGSIRVSPGYFNTSQDIDTFLAAVRELASAG